MYYIYIVGWIFGVFSLTDISNPQLRFRKMPRASATRWPASWRRVRCTEAIWWTARLGSPHGWASQGSCRFVGNLWVRSWILGVFMVSEAFTKLVKPKVFKLLLKHYLSGIWINDMGMIFEPGMKYYSHRAFIQKKVVPLHLNLYPSFSPKHLRYLHLHTLSHGEVHIT